MPEGGYAVKGFHVGTCFVLPGKSACWLTISLKIPIKRAKLKTKLENEQDFV
jgi:hypothetical protein